MNATSPRRLAARLSAVLATSSGALALGVVASLAGVIELGSASVSNGGAVHWAGSGPGSAGPYDVAAAGDVNGDGLPDLLVGTRTSSTLWIDNVYVVFGRAFAPGSVPQLSSLGANGYRIFSSSQNTLFFAGFAGVGDVNGDGLADVAVVSPGVNAVVFGRAAAGDVDVAALGDRGFQFRADQHGALGGNWTVRHVVAKGGDVNRDGLADIVLSARVNDNGVVHVLFGKQATGVADLAGFGIKATDAASRGVPGVGVGDVNRDGRSDVLVSVPGAAYVVFGTSTPAQIIDVGDLGVRGYRIELPDAAGDVSPVLGAAGDVNRDGRADVVIGVPAMNGGAGAAYVVFGKDNETPLALDSLGVAGYRIDGHTIGDAVGSTVDGAGDVNRDGRPDIVTGAPGARTTAGSQHQNGSVYVVFGKSDSSGVELSQLGLQGFRINGPGAALQAGSTSVSGPGDVDGDGHADVLFGTLAHGGAWLVWSRFPTISYQKEPVVARSGGITLRGLVNPRGVSTHAFIEWGPTTRYGTRTAARAVGNGTVRVALTETLLGRRDRLIPGRTYHFRVVATNATFGAAYGADRTFVFRRTP